MALLLLLLLLLLGSSCVQPYRSRMRWNAAPSASCCFQLYSWIWSSCSEGTTASCASVLRQILSRSHALQHRVDGLGSRSSRA